jgi:hypothetical protein
MVCGQYVSVCFKNIYLSITYAKMKNILKKHTEEILEYQWFAGLSMLSMLSMLGFKKHTYLTHPQ